MDGLFEIFRISRTEGGGSGDSGGGSGEELKDLAPKTKQHNLFDNYLCLLLICFLRADLLKGLIEVGSKKEEYRGEGSIEESNRSKAASLLAELLQISSFLLPKTECSILQTLPSLVENATSFSQEIGVRRVRTRASSMVFFFKFYFYFILILF